MDNLLAYGKSWLSEASAKLDSNSLEWLEQRKHLYPKFVGTSVPSERLFSTAGNIVSSKCN